MKKFFLFTVATLLSVGLFAQSDEKQNTPRRKEVKHTVVTTHGPMMLQGSMMHQDFGVSDLTDEQRKSMKELRLAMDKEVRKNTNLLREKKAHLTTLQDEDKPDQKAIHKTIDEITALQGQIMKVRADFHTKVSALLTDEQRAAFQRHSSMRGHKNFEPRFDADKISSLRKAYFNESYKLDTSIISKARATIYSGKFSDKDVKVKIFNSNDEEIEVVDWKSINPEKIKTIRITKGEKGESQIQIDLK
jgi:Spy/CpxP family protein refolding chaperone